MMGGRQHHLVAAMKSLPLRQDDAPANSSCAERELVAHLAADCSSQLDGVSLTTAPTCSPATLSSASAGAFVHLVAIWTLFCIDCCEHFRPPCSRCPLMAASWSKLYPGRAGCSSSAEDDIAAVEAAVESNDSRLHMILRYRMERKCLLEKTRGLLKLYSRQD